MAATALLALLMLIRTLRPLSLLTRKTNELARMDFTVPPHSTGLIRWSARVCPWRAATNSASWPARSPTWAARWPSTSAT